MLDKVLSRIRYLDVLEYPELNSKITFQKVKVFEKYNGRDHHQDHQEEFKDTELADEESD